MGLDRFRHLATPAFYVVTTAPSSTTCTTSALTCTLTGLAPGTAYAFVVRADNAHVGQAATGLSPVASTTASVLPAVPTSPESLAVAGSDRVLRLSFAPPADPGASPVLGYEASTDDGATWAPLVTTGTRILAGVVGPVLTGQSYPGRVRAYSALGPGDPSTAMPVSVGQWYADPISRRKRATEVAVPARPKAYAGRTRSTVATYRSATGAPVLALISLRKPAAAGRPGRLDPDAPALRAHAAPGDRPVGAELDHLRPDGGDRARLRRHDDPELVLVVLAPLHQGRSHPAPDAGREPARRPRALVRGLQRLRRAASTAMRLSTRRAKAVCRALVGYGAPVTVTSRGYGVRRPVVVGPAGVARDTNNRFVVLVTRD